MYDAAKAARTLGIRGEMLLRRRYLTSIPMMHGLVMSMGSFHPVFPNCSKYGSY